MRMDIKELTLIFLCATLNLNAANWEYSFSKNKVNIINSNMSINDASFYATIIVDGKVETVQPYGEPSISTLQISTPIGMGLQKKYVWNTPDGYQFEWILTDIGKDIYAIKSSFTNGSSKAVQLKDFVLIDTPLDKMKVKGNPQEWMLATTDVEIRRWGTLDKPVPSEIELQKERAYSRSYFLKRGFKDRAADSTWRVYLGDATLYKEPGTVGTTFAAVDTVSDVYYHFKVNGTKMKCEIECDMSEIVVDAGEKRSSDEVLVISKPWSKAQQLKNTWIKFMSQTKITKNPAFGWCSWYTYGLSVTPEAVDGLAGYIGKNRNKLPFEIAQIDDGWQVSRGIWIENGKFVDKMKPIADNIKSDKMIPGIWLSPIRVDKLIGVCNTAENIYPKDWYVSGRLDPTHPEVQKFIKSTLRKYVNLGYSYFKLDFSQVAFGAKDFYNKKMTRFQAQRETFRIYREAIGPDAYLTACGISDQRSMVPYVDADRIGTDTGMKRGFAHRPLATDNQPADIQGFWYPILSMAGKCYENGILTNGDPDVTYTRQLGNTTLEQLHTFHSFVGIYAGLAMTSMQFDKSEFDTNDDLRMMELLYPISKEKGHSFTGGWDIYGTEFGYQVNRPFSKWTNVIVWNPQHEGSKDLTIKNTPVPSRKFHVWSFWDEEYKGIFDKNYSKKNVAPYQCELLRLTAVSKMPVIIGSNLHISMGSVEIKDMHFSADKMNIELDSNAGARSGIIYIYSDKKLADAQSTNSEALLVKKAKNLYMVILNDRIRDKKDVIEIAMGKTDAPTLSEVNKNPHFKSMIQKATFTNIKNQ